MHWIMELDIDFMLILSHLVRIGVSYVLALPIAYDRERAARSAGLRTFPLVAVGCCAYTLLGIQVLEGSQSNSRVLYGLMAGIGFIGGGAILKQKSNVHGTATAASIWVTGAIGASTAWQRYEIALILSLITLATLSIGREIKRDINGLEQDSDEDA